MKQRAEEEEKGDQAQRKEGMDQELFYWDHMMLTF